MNCSQLMATFTRPFTPRTLTTWKTTVGQCANYHKTIFVTCDERDFARNTNARHMTKWCSRHSKFCSRLNDGTTICRSNECHKKLLTFVCKLHNCLFFQLLKLQRCGSPRRQRQTRPHSSNISWQTRMNCSKDLQLQQYDFHSSSCICDISYVFISDDTNYSGSRGCAICCLYILF